IIVPGEAGLQILDACGVYDHVVEIPQINVREIGGELLLNLTIDRLPFGLIDLAASLFDPRINLWIAVEAAVGALGRKARRMKHVLKDIGILVGAADPTQGVELISAFG